ncbi:hypothetical protein [Nostoc sp.]|uniref:hypothetical protein n=1 Tax=Nostoc sp. TaxID=1180 RepID=UPI002FF77CBC
MKSAAQHTSGNLNQTALLERSLSKIQMGQVKSREYKPKLNWQCSSESVTHYTRLLIEAVILFSCVRSKLKNKKRLGWKHGNTPRRFLIGTQKKVFADSLEADCYASDVAIAQSQIENSLSRTKFRL